MNEWVLSNGGMILTGENWSTERKTLYSVGGRWMSEYGAMVEWYWQEKTEVLGEKHYTAWAVDEWMSMEQWWNDSDRGNLKYSGKPCPCFPVSITNLTWTDLLSNPCLRGKKPRTNSLFKIMLHYLTYLVAYRIEIWSHSIAHTHTHTHTNSQ